MFPESANSFPPYHSKTEMKNMLVMGDDSSVSDGKNGYCPAVRQLQTNALRTDNQCRMYNSLQNFSKLTLYQRTRILPESGSCSILQRYATPAAHLGPLSYHRRWVWFMVFPVSHKASRRFSPGPVLESTTCRQTKLSHINGWKKKMPSASRLLQPVRTKTMFMKIGFIAHASDSISDHIP